MDYVPHKKQVAALLTFPEHVTKEQVEMLLNDLLRRNRGRSQPQIKKIAYFNPTVGNICIYQP